MGERLLTAARDAVQEVAETMLFLEIKSGTADHHRCDVDGEVSALVAMSGGVEGAVRLSGPSSTVIPMASALLGEEREEMDQELEDAFLELGNMVAGGIQVRIETKYGDITITPPVLFNGEEHPIFSEGDLSVCNHRFELQGKLFFVEIYYDEERLGRVAEKES
ncbi:MAG: chemotaxis protein CheX [Magnetococcales bacterium]|nr:chemotaxis protein CheX [Magnetococcales bacterium]